MELLQSQGREHPVESSRYICKICSKGFVSERALGGHMRAHLPACMPAEKFIATEFRKSRRPNVSNDQSMEEKDDEEVLDGNGENLIFSLRRNPKCTCQFAYWDDSFLLIQGLDSDSIDSSLNCDLCGKEFSSWKGLFGHMNCCCETHQDSGDARLEESHKHEHQDEEGKSVDSNSKIEMDINHPSGNLSRFDKCLKEKRLKRPRYVLQRNPHAQFVLVTNKEEEDMALCLLMLANGVNNPQNPQCQVGVADPESGYLKLPNNGSQRPKSMSKRVKYNKINEDASLYDDETKEGRYKCTTCSKVFQSYQALGGHSAMHAKVNRCFTQIEDEQESLEEEITDDELNIGSGSQLPGNFHKPHPMESTKDSGGKARDGMRTIESPAISDTITTGCGNKETPMLQHLPNRVELLDLNLPAPFDGDFDAGDLYTLDCNAVDSPRTSHAQTHNLRSLLSSSMSNHPRQGLFLYNKDADLSKNDEADSKVGKDIRFGRGSH
eukprot:PITA_19451